MKSNEINELAIALSKAQGEISPAVKDKFNPFFRSNYSSLDSIRKACKGPLSNNGLSVSQIIVHEEGVDFLDTMLLHSSGQWIKSRCRLVTKDGSAQQFGSSVTYMSRYSYSAIVGISSDEDDDGNQAQGKQEAQSKPQGDHILSERASYIQKCLNAAPAPLKKNITDWMQKNDVTFQNLNDITSAQLEKALQIS